MYLYSRTLQRPTGVVCAVIGSFSGRDSKKSNAAGSSTQEIAVARGGTLDLLRPDPETGRLRALLSVDVFGSIRSLAQFRLTGATKDYLVVGSDSGRLVTLEYSPDRNRFDKVHQETFGKSGCCRIMPGQLLSVDPKGRALCIAALEKQKLVYVLNRDASARLTISSPLTAHKSHTLTFALRALDCGFCNPVFGAIELEYGDSDRDPTGQAAGQAQKVLTFYELDLGLNHVSRNVSEPIDNGANLLVTVPGGGDGPSGLLVCCDNFVLYRNQGHPEVRAVIPRRVDLPSERAVVIVAAATHRQKSLFFFLIQTENGDIFKVDLEHSGEVVTELRIKYFDTIPVASAICVLRSGFLFAASEFGSHALYQFCDIGRDVDVESSSATLKTEEALQPVFFHPRALKNLVRIDKIESIMPIIDMRIANLFDLETHEVFTACGRGSRSTMDILWPGLAISEMARSTLPAEPIAVWTVKKNINDMVDNYFVASFANATLVLSIGEPIEEVSVTQFLDSTHSLAVSLLAKDSQMQVHPNRIAVELSAGVVKCAAIEKQSLVENSSMIKQPIENKQASSQMQNSAETHKSSAVEKSGGMEKQMEKSMDKLYLETAELIDRLDPNGAVLLMCLASPLYAVLAVWTLLWLVSDQPQALLWAFALLACLYLFLWIIVLSKTRLSVVFFRITYILMLAFTVAHLIGPVNGIIFLYTGMIYVAGMLGYAVAEYFHRAGFEQTANTLCSTPFNGKDFEEKVCLMRFCIVLMSTPVLARMLWVFFAPYSGQMTHMDVLRVMVELTAEIFVLAVLWIIYIIDFILRGALVSMEKFVSIASICCLACYSLAMLLSFNIAEVIGMLVMWLGWMAIGGFFGYCLAVRAFYCKKMLIGGVGDLVIHVMEDSFPVPTIDLSPPESNTPGETGKWIDGRIL